MKTCNRCKVEMDESAFYAKRDGTGTTPRCKACYCEVSRRSYRKRTPEQNEARREDSRLKQRAYKARHAERVRARARDHYLKKTYGLTLLEQNAYVSAQDGKCAICRQELRPGSHGLCVDHCHGSGQIRGLLCNSCNLGIGYFKDNPVNLQRAIAYLIKHDAPSRHADLALLAAAGAR
jgi:hypothetical protein